MSVQALRLIAFILALGFGTQAWAANKNPCPPVIPRPDLAKMQKATSSSAMTAQQWHNLLAGYSRTIKKPTTWSGCHTVRDTIRIQAPVTMAPGATLKFKANAGLKIEQNGSLDATGTADKPIVFTATDKTPGYWYGLYFHSRSSHNRLTYAKVLYAGGVTVGVNGMVLRRAGGDNNPPSRALYVLKGASLSVSHSLVAHSGGYGLEALGELETFTNNTIEHTRIPMRLRLDDAGHVAASNKLVHNDTQRIDVIGNKTLTRDGTWQALGLPYYLPFYTTIDANLKLEPGVALRMGDGSTLDIDEAGGSLNAVGTAARPIVIRGWSKQPGYWGGINVSSHSGKNVLRYVKVADGGASSSFILRGNVYVGGYLELKHSWIENSSHNGLIVDHRGGVEAVLKASGNKFKHNKVNEKIWRSN